MPQPRRASKLPRHAQADAERWPLGWAVAACFSVFALQLSLALQRLLWPRPQYPQVERRGVTRGLAEELQAAAAAGVPVVLTGVESLPPWGPAEISALQLTRVYVQESPIFGPYYDTKRPLGSVGRVRPRHNYTEESMRGDDFFGRLAPPWRYYSGEVERDLSASLLEQLRPLERGLVAPCPSNPTPTLPLTLTATLTLALNSNPNQVALRPSRSSANLWLGRAGGTAPCHYDGYHNAFAQYAAQGSNPGLADPRIEQP